MREPLRAQTAVLIPILKGIAQTIGPWFEVVIHDLSDPKHSLIFIYGELTGRKVGAPVTDLAIMITVLAVNIIGNVIRDLLDPRI